MSVFFLVAFVVLTTAFSVAVLALGHTLLRNSALERRLREMETRQKPIHTQSGGFVAANEVSHIFRMSPEHMADLHRRGLLTYTSTCPYPGLDRRN